MAETPTQSPPPRSVSDTETETEEAPQEEYWCYHCNKRVSVETVANVPDIVCHDCKNGFVESIPQSDHPLSQPSDQADDDPTFGSPFLQVLRLIPQAARDEDSPPPLPQNPTPEEDFLRIELDDWDNDDAHSVEFHNEGGEENEEAEEEEGEEEEEEEDRSDREEEEVLGDQQERDEEDMRRRHRDVLRLRIRDIATRARSGRNRMVEILMGLEDNSIELRLEMPESDRYVGNPEDYVDAAGYEALLQTLAESDSSGRRGAPPASKAAVSELPTVEIKSVDEAVLCAICKDMVNVGEMSKKLPCGHGYHGDCIVPWLSSRNSCPVCRYELPTDDQEYEEEKKKQAVNVSVGASGSGGDNAVSG